MTSQERMLAAIHHVPPDRVPVSPWGLGRIPIHSSLGRELVARTDPWIEIGLGCHPVGGADLPLEVEQHGNSERRILHAPGRNLVSIRTTTAETTACTDYFCETKEDIEALHAIPYEPPHPDVEAYRELREEIGQDGLVVMGVPNALCYPNDMLGTEYCSYLWAADPDVIRDLVVTAAERIHRVAEEACEAGVDCFRIVGGEYATQLMGPRAWDELIVPHDEPLVEMIQTYDAIAHYHNHGNMQAFLEPIADLGIDSLDPIEQPPYGDVEMDEAMRRIGDRVCLVGGLDDMEALETRPPQKVRAMAEDLIERVGTVGYMLGGTSSGIYGKRAAQNFVMLVEVAQQHA